MNSRELRKAFLEFFESKGHKIIRPASLVASDDKSVLFNVAGMQQFKPYFSGEKDVFSDIHPGLETPLRSKRIATCQPCIRTVDIDEVGDKSHLTVFEMVGNFSFNDYFKKDTIKWAFEFVTDILKLDINDLEISVFKGEENIPFDVESYETWKALGIKESQFRMGGREDNFWGPVGKEGACGPCSEIYYKGLEIWNLVFNQYYQNVDKSLTVLEKVGVDTGSGFERILLVSNFQNDFESKSIYDTDIFSNQMQMIKSNSDAFNEKYARIVLDHFKASVFLIANGVVPNNVERGYVLRRLIRRILRYQKQIGLKDEVMSLILNDIQIVYGEFYPEILKTDLILDIFNKEIAKFSLTLENGLKELNKIFDRTKNKMVSSIDAFLVYESFGFPIELIKEEAIYKGFDVDVEGFYTEFERHKEVSRAGVGNKFGGHDIGALDENSDSFKNRTKLHTATHLLLKALREVLGDSIYQKGSDINDERLRLDFPFERKIELAEIKKIEDLVNEKIQEGLEISFTDLPLCEALENGFIGVFMGKYPEIVKAYNIGDWSKEICAGPHVNNTKELGAFKILKEESSGAGIRRIKAILN